MAVQQGTKSKSKATKKAIDIALVGANKSKRRFQVVVSIAQNLRKLIKTDPNWEWANHDHVHKNLDTALNQLMLSVDEFSTSFFSTDFKELRRQHEEEALTAQLMMLPERLDSKMALVDKECSKLNAMHRAHLSF